MNNQCMSIKKILIVTPFLLLIILLFIRLCRTQWVYAENTIIIDRTDDIDQESIETYNFDGDPGNYAIDLDNIGNHKIEYSNYISNGNYFIVNPYHAEHDKSKNENGTCTTIAMQLLIGYHNYYSDRRIIPEESDSGNKFLIPYYADPKENPKIYKSRYKNLYMSLGTEDELYNELYNLTPNADGLLGQTIGNVCSGAREFVRHYSSYGLRDSVDIDSSLYNMTDVLSELRADRPVILVFSPISSGVDSDNKSFHVVVAYGYAVIDGKLGYIVHYGWSTNYNHAWVPADCFGYMATMRVKHDHNFVDSNNNVWVGSGDSYRELICNTCGCNTVDDLYGVEEITNVDSEKSETQYRITGVNYPLLNSICIPRSIRDKEVVEIGDGAFKETTMSGITFGDITKIGNGAFENCLNLTTVDIMFVDNIGDNAFSGCSNLRDIYISDRLTDIGKGAYRGCYNATIYVNENNPKFATDSGSNILYDKSKSKIIHAGKVDRDLEIHSTVTYIEDYAFSDNIYLESIRFKSNPKIGCGAFSDCKNLKWIYYEQSVPPEVGEGALTNVDVSINVPYKAQSAFKTAFSPYPESNITSVEFLVIFIDGESILHTEQAYYGSDIDEFYMPVKIGYNFDGWYDDPEFVGERYLNGGEWKTESDVIYYSKWIPNTYTVTLDPDGGVLNGENSVTAEYGRLLPNPPTVTRQGYELEGWYDQNNKKYITAEGQGIAPWDKTVNTTLKALWRPYEYTIKIMSDKIALTESGKDMVG